MPSHSRRRFLAAVGAASTVLTGCLSGGDATPSGDLGTVDGSWRMAGRNGGHTRRVPDGPADPETVWLTELDGARATGTPAVVRGDMYVPVDAASDSSRYRHRIHALEAATGEERWQVPLRANPNGPPAVRGNHVVVTARRSVERGRVVCFDSRYGDEHWLYDVDARLTAPPTIAGAVAYVPDSDGWVHALSVFDGAVRWSRRLGDDDDHAPSFSEAVAVHDGVLYVGSSSGRTGVTALDAATGAVRWQLSTAPVMGGPVVHGDRVVVRTRHAVVAFDLDGTHRWSFGVADGDVLPVAVDDQHVYVATRDRLSPRISAVDRRGETVWTYESAEQRVGTPTVVGDSVVVRGRDSLVGLSRDTGEERWTRSPDGTGRAVVTPNAMLLSGYGGRVVALGDG
ncbi:outer membrane protein assembly factor BamB family protein [Haloarchaeobius iranensis]|uniref:PQQ-like domain-containing protein n=1 Tax=Haloarchaeobius iranensis TaxID=996166 RepID=A0A1G9ZHC6_9EURY|nr:PQQ-binding-like beta-propeller repeat protein [Haloarchaeobius iranensis]SDN20852.1 PQQ-like domain-containing protein [Haloarchaeobius iranensis]